MAITTYNTKLTWGATEGATTNTVRIKDYPDLGGPPNLVEMTDLEDDVQRFSLGVRTASAMPFTCNFDETVMANIEVSSGTTFYYTLHFGEDGVNGKVGWQGQHSVHIVGKSIDDPREMILTVVPSTRPKLLT